MPDAAPSSVEVGESESRTASMGRRLTTAALPTSTSTSTSTSSLPSATSSPRSTSSKKRRRGKKKSSDVRDFVPMGANFSKSSELLQTSPSSPTNPAHPSSPISQTSQDDGHDPTDTAPSNRSLGNNRLATGFKPTTNFTNGVPAKSSRNYSFSSSPPDIGGSMDDVIEISSDEDMEDSEGGMIVNLNDNTPALTENSMSEDEGEVTSDDEADLQIQQDLTGSADPVTVDDTTSSNLRLLDLNPEELEEQLKYALYHLDRTQVDLNRLVTCLSCMQVGHISSECPQSTCKHCEDGNDHATSLCPFNKRCTKCRERGHTGEDCISDMKNTTVPCDICSKLSHVEQACPQRHFLQPALETPVKLWISCCICASKSHLVGDCADAPRNAATACWSLKSLDPGQITNLSLESGTRRLEKDAETRGMRPSGMQIKGRATLHHAGISKSAPVSEDEQEDFLHPSVRRNNLPQKPQVRIGAHQIRRPDQPRPPSDRYDRFEAPSFDAHTQDRGRGDWYATDSFGRRRSRSPKADTWRPGLRRSPSPRRFDGYPQSDRGYRGPPSSDYWRPSQGSLPPRPPIANNHPTAASSNPHRPVQLPSRKGSNPSLPSKPPTVVRTKSNTQQNQETNNPSKAQGSNGGRRKKNKKKRVGGGPSDSEPFANSGSDNDFSVLGSVTTKDLTFSSDGAICLDLPDNIQAWLDKINSKRKSKCQKPMFVCEVEDTPHPSQMKLYDAETGATRLEKGIACSNIAAKGFRLLVIPQAVHDRPDQQIAQQPTRELAKEQPAEEPAQPSTQELDYPVHQDFGQQTTTRGGGMTLRNGMVTDAEQPSNQESGHQILCEGGGMKLRNGTVTGVNTRMIQPHGRGESNARSCPTGSNRVQVLPDILADTGPMVEAGAPSEVINRNESTSGHQIRFGDLSAWLELENSLRRAQGKDAVQLRRASAGETDHHGQPILQYLTDPATGAYRALGQRRLNDMRKIGKLLRLQKEQRALDKQERRYLEGELRVTRGQALPQPAPPKFAAAIHAGYKKAASEGRQLVLSQLSGDVTAADIEQFFGDLGVETICIGYDSITDIPTGVAHVDMETSRGANEAVQSLAEKKLLGKEVHLKLNINRNASSITRLVRELSILPDRVVHDFGTSPTPAIDAEAAGGSTTDLDDEPERTVPATPTAPISPLIITDPI